MTDQQLCQLLHKGDKKSFDLIYERYWKRMFLYAYKIFEDQLVCEDLVQEVFVRLWERSQQERIQHLESYLIKATKYQVMNAIRNMKRTLPYEDILPNFPSDERVELVYEAQEASLYIDSSIKSLPERCQEVFVMSRREELSNREIAQRLNISVRTVESQLHKALKIIRRDLGKIYIGLSLFFWM
jgi:RNA polymerase sigma-70 factor (family 1)